MTELFVPTGRPVSRFVAVIAAVAALSGIIWWSGLFAPRLGTTVTAVRVDRTAGTATALVQVRNKRPLSVRLDGVRVSWEGESRVTAFGQTTAEDVPGSVPTEIRSVRIGGGGSVSLLITFTVDCAALTRIAGRYRGAHPSGSLHFRTRAAAGITRVMNEWGTDVLPGPGACAA